MTKTSRNAAAAAEESFHKHYAAIWGATRWQESLYPALAQQTKYAVLINKYASPEDFWKAMDEAQISRDELQKLALPGADADQHDGISCYARNSSNVDAAFPAPRPASNGLLTHWNLDAASALAAHLLNARPGDRILDLCAAPGGKSVTVAQSLFPGLQAQAETLTGRNDGLLRSNEAEPRRQKRLAENLQYYLPRQANVQCLRVDGTGSSISPLLVPGGYDKILVDAPCSSERHIIHAHLKARTSGNAAPEMTNWRPGSSKRLAQTQLALLMTALKAAKVGGTVLYATCSLETTENDGVVEKMLAQVAKEKKKGAKWAVEVGFGADEGVIAMEQQLEAWAERTNSGWIVLPDHPGGGRWGPLFFASLRKVLAG